MDSDQDLIDYVQLVALKRSLELLFQALAETLQTMETGREDFLRAFLRNLQGALKTDQEDYSAQAALLGLGCRQLLLTLAEEDTPPGSPPSESWPP